MKRKTVERLIAFFGIFQVFWIVILVTTGDVVEGWTTLHDVAKAKVWINGIILTILGMVWFMNDDFIDDEKREKTSRY